jgi:hypothetical protein
MKFHCLDHRFMKSMAFVMCMTGGLAACAGADFRPVVDMTGHTEAEYDRDLAVCQNQARSVRNNDDVAEDAGLGAGVGAVAGLVGAGGYKEAQTEDREQRIITNCMRARGFNVYG